MTGEWGGLSEDRALLAIAKQFREAATAAGRPDVVAKIDEAVILVVGPSRPGGRPDGENDKANVVLRILDGLGL